MKMLRTLGAVSTILALTFAAVVMESGASAQPGASQPNNPPPNGPRMTDGSFHAIRNATVHAKPGETVEHATIVVRDGRIVSVTAAPAPRADGQAPDAPEAPAGARVWDGTGLHVYPGMIDPYVEVDAPRPDANEPGAHWSRRVTPQRRATDGAMDEGLAKRMRDMGFVAAHIVPRGGIFRGSSAVVSLAEPPASRSASRPPVYRDDVVQAVAFDTGGVGGEASGGAALERWDGYPDSEMGAIALVRQTLHDAQWRADGRAALTGSDSGKAQRAAAMGFGEPAAIDRLAARPDAPPLLFVADDELDILRAERVAREFKRPASIYVGTGSEYQRLDAIKNRLASAGWLVVPLNYPEEPKVDSIGAAAEVDLRTLMEWEQAPANARRLSEAGVKFALTTGRVPDRRGGRGKFLENLRTAVRHGLKEDAAIALVTTRPAEMLGVDKDLGTIEPGKIASFVVTDGTLLDKKTKVRDVWIDGRRHEVNTAPTKLEGEYDVTIEPGPKTPGTLGMSIDKDNGVTLKKAPPPEEAKPGDAKPAEPKPGEAKPPQNARERATAAFDDQLAKADAALTDGDTGRAREHAARARLTINQNRTEFSQAEYDTFMQRVDEVARKIELKAEREPKQDDGVRVDPPRGDWVKEKDKKVGEALDRVRTLQAEGKNDEAMQVVDQILFLDPQNKAALQLKQDAATGGVKGEQPGDKPAADKPGEKPDKPEKKDDKPKEKTARAKNVKIDGKAGTISFVFDHEPFGEPGMFTVSGTFERTADGKAWTFRGDATRSDGTPFRWSATPAVAAEKPKDDAKKGDNDADKKDADKPAAGDQDAKPKDDGVSGTWTCTATGGPIPAGENHTVTMTVALADDGKVDLTLAGPMGEAGISEATYDKASRTLKATYAIPNAGSGTLTLTVGDNTLTGAARMGEAEIQITGTRAPPPGAKADAKGDDDEDSKPVVIPDLPGYPFGPYALKELPAQATVVITNATVWTSGPAGVIQNGAVVISAGKITYVGPGAGAPAAPADATVIDARGKHVTPGLIDCHSHTGISRGVNESGQAVTAEVRIQDVLNPDAINWYRQLAGGVTCVNNLHGSANPIGGQNAVNKIRWGVANPDDMHFTGADAYSDDNPLAPGSRRSTTTPGIKFALGENVKQSNWGEQNTTRYPQTRMGVETLIKDRFTAAREYIAAWEAFARTPGGIAPRRDLELEAIAELLLGQRLIHCHSYRQDEILMLARLTKAFGFKLGTYQHNLEGYKVADAVKDSAIGASLFSDWWAFKVEVQDAIPYAGAIMHDQGVVVSFNSDSDELARRMNVEAAKAVKYGGVKPEEALKFVTINPARQLKIDDRVGSLEVGKDADVALWSGDPLSAFTRCEATWVDGRLMYSLERDEQLRSRDGAERQRLLQKALGAKKKDAGASESPAGGGDAPRRRRPRDTTDAPANRPPNEITDEVARSGRSALIFSSVVNADAVRREYYMSLLRRGIDPANAGRVRGDCGCDIGMQQWMWGEQW